MLYKLTLNDAMKYLQCWTPEAQMCDERNKLTPKWRMALIYMLIESTGGITQSPHLYSRHIIYISESHLLPGNYTSPF